MAIGTMNTNEVLKIERCCSCAVVFAMPESMYRERRESRQLFYCPNGHGQRYTGPSELSRTKDELVRVQQRLEQEQAHSKAISEYNQRVTRRLSATKGVVTRQKKRISAGRCPCCSMTFKDLRQHMQADHPHWDLDREITAMEARP